MSLTLGGGNARAAQGPMRATPDKSAHTLFNPTPDAHLRELSTDRPDATESPFTVDAGHVQLEMDFANYGRDRQNGVKVTEEEAVPFNLRLGLTRNWEAGLFVTPYRRECETPRGGPRETRAGFGDVTLRTKLNLLGNDGGAVAWGVMADLKLPTAGAGMGNGKIEGAVTLPVAFELAGGWGVGAMTSVEFRHRGAGGGYRAVWINTTTVGHDLAKDLAAYGEVTSAAGDGTHVATVNFGLAWQLNTNTQLDGGVNIGASRAAADLGIFAGLSRRF